MQDFKVIRSKVQGVVGRSIALHCGSPLEMSSKRNFEALEADWQHRNSDGPVKRKPRVLKSSKLLLKLISVNDGGQDDNDYEVLQTE